MKRIGVFVCHCGLNIADTVDIKKVVEDIGKHPNVAHVVDYTYMCSDPGQEMIKSAIVEKKLDGVIVAACTPTLHETTFRNAISSVGLNKYQFENANIREQCSWVHKDNKIATEKAIEIIKSIIEKLKLNQSLSAINIPVTRKALVIGGGISGMQAALDIANSGYEVVLVEKTSSIGGRMSQLSETFPTLDCASCILTPKTVEVGHHPNIKLLTYSEVEGVEGYLGNFKVKIRKKPAYVDWDKCTGCGICSEKCPTKISSEFERDMGTRKAIYIPFPQAVPKKPVIDSNHCIYFKTGKCKLCEKNCPIGAIDYDQKETTIEEEIGVILVATGFDLLPKESIGEYGYGKYQDVIDGLQFERLLSASGPTAGKIKRPSDGKIPKDIVFVQCVGSRDPEHGMPYCSKICCMYTAKHALLYKHAVHDGQAYVFYIDIRSGGKGYEEFVQKAVEDEKIIYLRGKVSRIFKDVGDDGKLIVWGVDTLTGKKIEIAADMVVLAMAAVPNKDTKELAKKLKISTDTYGFINEAHPKLRPVETLTAGIFLMGCAQAPKDIPETVAQASGAAARALTILSKSELEIDPLIAAVDEDICTGCGICLEVCAYNARKLHEIKKIAEVNEALCVGCGSCISACPSNASIHKNYTKEQILRMIEEVT
ncbi:MAG: CoB--CoM heterodisulfide reductase iron-sulfur subunit A family protein [Thermoplasmatales archaeon]|nr:MAG: CoB--CoM heterodisulfide reductase iron-sulfur subunit A family protein [Thermoplasmatales archaeon]